jgi:hypothetical protein
VYYDAKRFLIRAELGAHLLLNDGGFTVDPITGCYIAPKGEGYVVGLHPHLGVQVEGLASAETLADCFYYLSEKEPKGELPYVGAWYDKTVGRTYVDFTARVKTREEALALAKLHSQKSIYNRATGEVEDVS